MKINFGSPASDASVGRHLLLGGWRDVVDDVRRLSADFRRSHGVCACGHAAHEPGGSCLCCRSGTSRTDCVDCSAQINALAVKFDTLIDDSLRFLPLLADILGARAAPEELQQLHAVGLQIGMVDGTFRRLATASEEFRRGCGASHTTAVARLADDLLYEVWTLEAMLEPNAREWPELARVRRERELKS